MRKLDEPDSNFRMLLFRIGHSHEPSHDEVDESDGTSEILWIEKLHLHRMLVRFVVIQSRLSDARCQRRIEAVNRK